MHELGIVFHIIRGVEEVGRKNRVKRVSAVTLQMGEVSGVVEHYLQDCWRWAADRSELLKGAQLRVETIPARTLCEDCGEIYPTVPHGKTCPACGSQQTHLLQGSEMLIKAIEVPEENDVPPEPEGEGEIQCPVCGRA